MGFEDLYYRFTGSVDPEGDNDTDYTHVYVVWKPESGVEIPIDGTYNQFGKEVKYLFKMDKKAAKPKLRLLRGHNQISNQSTNWGDTIVKLVGGYILYKIIF